ncbi:C-terminal binding protein [Rhodococcus sp. BP-349]|uniref:C-terminal binding protein n=1 Tax=unclassified Rhodococcus (in: high G+C Gram-positive bacteria) TaxID=192944 RepID=UPI001C9B08A0|nr:MULTISPECIES: C-terminal binding protein [unclassified Rhodococcus (in: high G+C Gram-positive bacteria)]MBY6537283.1 C-terminal binding protein [Rhodococcus sp. BP-363]MBY6541620.1 C-terminal binding protein [Rhodococcus sp. BP-369]MBY6560850.1 C-terminal binding protein [Rhodococcus sp. BP-370]MBY6575142.1 C-terminal binding protein [Rhodococcus sp. BP-364]MBY6584443.1 C-terminal binding protein [Rhodococcus sp. BP-358]
MRIVVTDHAFENVLTERRIADDVDAEFEVFDACTEDEAVSAVTGADVVLVNFAPMNERVLKAMNRGGVVIRYGIGYDNVDLDAADRLGVSVCNVPDYGGDTVADHAVTLALMLLRKVTLFDRVVTAGDWVSATHFAPILSSTSTTVGLLGTGRIGMAVAARLAPFGFEVIAYDPFADTKRAEDAGVELVDLEQLFRRSNVLSLHAPATPDTKKIVDAQKIAKMPFGSYIVNTSRGSLLDQNDVLAALNAGQLAGVGLDVFDPEPLPRDHGLRSHPHAILTPHAAFYSLQSLQALQRLAAEEAGRAARREPLRCCVNNSRTRTTSPGVSTS